MTQDEIIRMARDAGSIDSDENVLKDWMPFLERFAALVAAFEREKFLNKLDGVSEKVIYETVKEAVLIEREACAKVCEEVADDYRGLQYDFCGNNLAEVCAADIRARGNHG